MFLELFLFAKKMKFLTNEIHYISRSSLGSFILCAGYIYTYYNMYICTAAFIVHNVYR